MPRLVIALSGPLASGKSELAEGLQRHFAVLLFSTREHLRARGAQGGRADQRTLGDELDKAGGRWVAEGVGALLQHKAASEDVVVVVDAVRRASQVGELRSAFGPGRVMHVHVTAAQAELERRYDARAKERGDTESYEHARSVPTEAQVEDLAPIADVVIDSTRCDGQDVLVIAAHRLGLYPRAGERLVDVVVGGEYGSEGKGNIASYLAREYGLLVRGGGPNAGHKVPFEAVHGGHPDRIALEGDAYTHHQLPSGTRTSSARILIVPGAVLNLEEFLKEASDCELEVDRLAIDPHAVVIEPDRDIPAESDLSRLIGSTARGVGAATARRIMDRGKPMRLARDIPQLQPYLRWAADVLEESFHRGERVMLEGTQGAGLSIWHGRYPWVTSRDTTATGCLAEAGIPPARVRRIIMTCRANPIRVQSPPDGSSGPMRWRGDPDSSPLEGDMTYGEIDWHEIERRSGIPYGVLTKTEKTSTTNRQRRVGEFDWVWLHRAAQLSRPTDIALTFADYLDPMNKNARRVDQLSAETRLFIDQLEAVAEAPVSLISTGFSHNRIIDRRRW